MEIAEFLAQSRVPVIKCRSFRDYDAVFTRIEEEPGKKLVDRNSVFI